MPPDPQACPGSLAHSPTNSETIICCPVGPQTQDDENVSHEIIYSNQTCPECPAARTRMSLLSGQGARHSHQRRRRPGTQSGNRRSGAPPRAPRDRGMPDSGVVGIRFPVQRLGLSWSLDQPPAARIDVTSRRQRQRKVSTVLARSATVRLHKAPSRAPAAGLRTLPVWFVTMSTRTLPWRAERQSASCPLATAAGAGAGLLLFQLGCWQMSSHAPMAPRQPRQ